MLKQYYMPTRVIMGENCIKENASVLLQLGKKALIVTGANSAKQNGSLKDVTDTLKVNGQQWSLYDKVMNNPTVECAYEVAAFVRTEKADFIIAIGGGSPMDAAKAAALLACQDIPKDELFSGKYGQEILPMAFIPTTAGTGSEVTPYSILTNHKSQTKMSVSFPKLFPQIAFLDAKYMYDMPIDTTINTAIDALSHSVEGMFSIRANALTDALASESIRMISLCFDGLKKNEVTKAHREKLLYASTLGGMVISNTGTTAVHAMGYSLTYYKNIDHGRANGLLIAAFLRLAKKQCPEKIRDILSMMGMKEVDELKHLLDVLLGEKEPITEEEIKMFTDKAFISKNIKNGILKLEKNDLLNIYITSFQ